MSRRLRAVLPWAFLLGSLGGMACAKRSPSVQYAPPSAEQARVFEHGVDFVAGLEGLEGRWREEWDRDLAERVRSADFIGIVTIHTLRTDTDPSQRVTHHLIGKVERDILGEYDGDEIELSSRQGQLGFPTVHDNLARLNDRPLLLYVKWYRDDAGERAAHWHLSPASDAIVGATEVGIAQASAARAGGGDRE